MNGTYKMWRNEIKKKKKNVVEKIRTKRNAIKKRKAKERTQVKETIMLQRKWGGKREGVRMKKKEMLQWEVSFDRFVVDH